LKKNKNNKLLKICIIFSIAIHVMAIFAINRLEIKSYLSSKNIMFSDKTNALPYNKKTPREVINLVLKEKQKQKNLQRQFIQPYSLYLPSKEGEIVHKNSLPFQSIGKTLNTYVFCLPELHSSNKLIQSNITLPKLEIETQKICIPNFEIPLAAKTNNKKNIILPNKETENKISTNYKEFFLSKKITKNILFQDFSEKENFCETNFYEFKQKQIKLFPHNFSLIDIPKLDDLATLCYKDYFDTEVTFSPQKDNNGYIFAITLIPKSSIRLNKLKKNIYFLIDKSNSIQNDRLTSTRHAIASALSLLEKDDEFNIFAFDNKMDILSNINLHKNNTSLSKAKSFLRELSIGSFFSSTNYSLPLFKVINNNTKKDEINIAILLSNGEGLNKSKQTKIINEWTRLNKGNLSLYSINLSDDKNTSILEMFSALNKGKLITSTTKRGIKRKLNKLLSSINAPIAKNIVANAICLDEAANIKLYTSNSSPALFLNEPYVILGTMDKLEDFTIFIQGHCKNSFFNLKKKVSFEKARQSTSSLQKELALKQAIHSYEKYIVDNNSHHLLEAKNLLEPFDIKPIIR